MPAMPQAPAAPVRSRAWPFVWCRLSEHQGSGELTVTDDEDVEALIVKMVMGNCWAALLGTSTQGKTPQQSCVCSTTRDARHGWQVSPGSEREQVEAR